MRYTNNPNNVEENGISDESEFFTSSEYLFSIDMFVFIRWAVIFYF